MFIIYIIQHLMELRETEISKKGGESWKGKIIGGTPVHDAEWKLIQRKPLT